MTVTVDASTEDVMAALLDLARYGEWIDVVHRVEAATADAGDHGPAWWVTLRAAIGPLARNKRLRITRSHDGQTVTFSRREIDGRDHAAWEMTATAQPAATGTDVTVNLAYGGTLWSGLLDGVLDRAIDTAIRRLDTHLRA